MGDEPVDWSSVAFDADGRLVDLSDYRFVTWQPPAPGPPVPVVELAHVFGRRLILMREDGPLYDYRAASEVFTDDQGSWIRVIPEDAWYRWRDTPDDQRPDNPPRAKVWRTHNVYVESYAT